MAQIPRNGDGEGLVRSFQNAGRTGSLLRTLADCEISRPGEVQGPTAAKVSRNRDDANNLARRQAERLRLRSRLSRAAGGGLWPADAPTTHPPTESTTPT